MPLLQTDFESKSLHSFNVVDILSEIRTGPRHKWRIPEEGVQAFYKDGVECQCVNRGSTCDKGNPALFLPYYKHLCMMWADHEPS